MSHLYNHESGCLYCCTTTIPPTKEHVVQKGLGGNVTLTRDVCGNCNSYFSALDTELVTYARDFHKLDKIERRDLKKILKGNTLTMQNANGETLKVQIQKDGKVRLFPQVVFLENGEIKVIGDKNTCDIQKLGEIILMELSDSENIRLGKPVILEGEEEKETPALIRSGKNQYFLRGSLEGIGFLKEKISQLKEKHFFEFSQPNFTVTKRPKIQGELKWKGSQKEVERALAKMAVNFLCIERGPEFARHEGFAPIRDYVRNGNNSNFSVVFKPNDFVNAEYPSFAHFSEYHLISLLPQEDKVLAIVTLYEKPFGCVYFPREPFLKLDWFNEKRHIVGVFDYVNREHAVLYYEDGTTSIRLWNKFLQKMK